MSTNRGQSILEKWLEDMPSSNQNSVKKEKKNLDDLFGSSSSFITNQLFLNQTPAPPKPTPIKPVPESKPYDLNAIDSKSVRGIFGWSTVNDIPLPYILRGEEKLVPVRAVELKIIGKFSSALPWKVFSCINIRSYFVTENEIKLLNEINTFHCENHYGFEPFSPNDVVVCLNDVLTLHKFLETSKGIFTYGLAKASIDWLGFVNISGSSIIPYIGKEWHSSSPTETPRVIRKYVPQSLIQHGVVLAKVDKLEMTEWDLSYLRMLCLYAGFEYYNIQSGDVLCYLNDLKWDSSLCPLYVEECSPPINKASHKKSPYTNPPAHSSSNMPSLGESNWLIPTSNSNSSTSPLSSLHQITKVDIEGSTFLAINLKPYSNQQAVFVSDISNKLFGKFSVLTLHYLLEKILQVKLYECTSFHENTYIKAGVQPIQGDKLVSIDVLRKCLPQLQRLVIAGPRLHSNLHAYLTHS